MSGTILARFPVVAFKSKRKKHRSPVEGPLRRLPGQSVRDERERLFDDEVVAYLLVLIIVWLFAFWQWIYKWTAAKPQPEFCTVVAILVSLYCVYGMRRFRAEFRNLNLAKRGERRVSEVLRQFRHRDYITFDDLLLGGINIDHVVVGPGGVFAIETKT
jgi:Nuclease-related domain